jgi:hypothetical protein
VLIVDGRLTQISISSPLEAKLHFLSCEWFSRLWTLQEGWLASDLRVQFANTAVSVDLLLRSFGTASIYPGRMGLDDELYKQLRPYFDKTAGAVSLMSLQRAMHGRRVTVLADEAICVATLLRLDFGTFKAGTPTMEQIFGQVKLPEGLMWGEGSRLKTPGFRWAPASLLGRYGNPRLLDNQEGAEVVHDCVLTGDGLRTRQGGFELRRGLDLGAGNEDITPVDSPDRQAVRLVICDDCGDVTAVFRASGKDMSRVGVGERHLSRPCIMVGSLRKNGGGEIMLGQGILVDRTQVIGGVQHGKYVLGLRHMDKELVEAYVHDRIVRVSGEFVESAEWCID